MRTLIILCAILLSACGGIGSNVLQGSGKVQTENRPISGVTAVMLTTSGSLTITQGAAESLTIESDDNILPLLTSEVENGTLTLATKPNTSINPTRIQYRLVVTDIAAITSTGSGDTAAGELISDSFTLQVNGSGDVAIEALTSTNPTITTTGSGNVTIRLLTAETLTVNQSSSGSVTLVGSAENQTITMTGSGDFIGEGLQGETANIRMESSGDATVNVSGAIDATLSGSGNLTYIGDPQVDENVSGSGKVNPRG
jgi:hypothetical protein